MKIAVISAGGWGLAMAKHLFGNGHEVKVWAFLEEEAKALNETHSNEKLLPGIKLDPGITFSSDISFAAEAELIIFATPSIGVYDTAEKLAPYIKKAKCCALLSKGFDAQNGYKLFSQTLNEKFKNALPIVALTGPSHAEEVALEMPTALVAASPDIEAANLVQRVVMNENLRVYTSNDIVGAQLGGAMKNIMAVAVGVSDGAGFGDNTKAMLMTRGIAEMSRLGVVLGGKAETFGGLSGVGDLIVTCISQHSRNRRAGLLIGSGLSPREAVEQVGTVEGFHAAKAIHELTAGMDIDLPICSAMYSLLFKCVSLNDVISRMLARGARPELD